IPRACQRRQGFRPISISFHVKPTSYLTEHFSPPQVPSPKREGLGEVKNAMSEFSLLKSSCRVYHYAANCAGCILWYRRRIHRFATAATMTLVFLPASRIFVASDFQRGS